MYMGRGFHMQMTTRYVRFTIKNYNEKQIKGIWGMNKKQLLAYCDKLDKAGYLAIPCEDADGRGVCKGWDC